MLTSFLEIESMGRVYFNLPRTAREVFEFRVFVCSHSVTEPAAFVWMCAQWIAGYAVDVDAATFARLEVDELGRVAEQICLMAETPPTHQQDLWVRLMELYGLDPEASREDETGAFDEALPWVRRGAGLAFTLCEDASALELPPWAFRLRALVKEVEALRRHDKRQTEAEVAETMRIATALGLEPVPAFRR